MKGAYLNLIVANELHLHVLIFTLLSSLIHKVTAQLQLVQNPATQV